MVRVHAVWERPKPRPHGVTRIGWSVRVEPHQVPLGARDCAGAERALSRNGCAHFLEPLALLLRALQQRVPRWAPRAPDRRGGETDGRPLPPGTA